MSDVQSYVQTTTTRVWAIPNPSNPAEFSKAYSAAVDSWRNLHGEDAVIYDDTFTLDANEEEIRISFQVTEDRK